MSDEQKDPTAPSPASDAPATSDTAPQADNANVDEQQTPSRGEAERESQQPTGEPPAETVVAEGDASPPQQLESAAASERAPAAPGQGPLAQRGKKTVVANLAADPQAGEKAGKPKKKKRPKVTPSGVTGNKNKEFVERKPIQVPNKRAPLEDDLQAELEAALAATDMDSLVETGGVQRPAMLDEGQQLHAQVVKLNEDGVFVSLGGPNEGVVPREHFEELPEPGQSIEVIVRGFNNDDGLYLLVVPGQALDVSDWDDLEEGTVVEAHATAANTGGLEVTVGSVRGFIPISQISEHRVEDASDFVGQKMMCVVTEVNPRRKNLVLSRRAVLERERAAKREEQLEQLEVGQTAEGTVRAIKDFGAFVDLGAVEGLIHISKLSWDRVKHPSEVLEVGQKVKVKIEKLDKQTGKMSLSYRDLLEDPWDSVEADFPAGSVQSGTVTRVADFGAFVRLGPGIEGLIHVSELAHHRVTKVNSIVQEGDTVEVKVLSIDRDAQRVGLSIKQAKASPEGKGDAAATEEEELPPREPSVKPQHQGPLKGGTGRASGGDQFGLRL